MFAFAPNHGPVGATVTLSGAGFSTTAGNNAVQFNGVAAAVSTASAAQLVVTVPIGATTGKISVTVGGSTVTSSDDFSITPEQLSPTITGFSPNITSIGGAVTLTGTNLQPNAGQTTLGIGAQVGSAVMSTINNNQIVFAAPANASGGKIRVTTPFGRAVSSDELVITPTGIAPGDVVGVTRLIAGGAAGSLNISAANKAGVYLFDASQPWLSLQISSLVTTASTVSYKLYDAQNHLIASGFVSTSSPTIHLPGPSMPGTFALYLLPGNATAQITAALEINSAVPTDGVGSQAASAIIYQSKRLTFVGTTGQNLGLGFTNLSLVPSSVTYFTVSVYKPDNTVLNSITCSVSDS
ncbi:MAG: IPT/TIG domain-containing protein, partial [Dokdonella sp.]